MNEVELSKIPYWLRLSASLIIAPLFAWMWADFQPKAIDALGQWLGTSLLLKSTLAFAAFGVVATVFVFLLLRERNRLRKSCDTLLKENSTQLSELYDLRTRSENDSKTAKAIKDMTERQF